MASASVVFDIIGRDRASSAFDKVGSSASKSQSKMGRLTGALKTAGKAAAIGLGAGAVIAGKALFDMTKAAAEDEKSQALLARTLKNAAGATDEKVAAVERWISSVGRATGVADDEMRPALQRLTEATGDVGKAQQLTSLAMDISAGTGKSLKTVSEALAKAQMGQVGALSRYGIRTRNAAGELMSFEQVVKGASKTFEGQAATAANTLDGKMNRLRLIFDETKESIGAKLIPVATKLADWFLTRGIPAIEGFGDHLGKLGPFMQKVRAVVGKVFGGMSGDVGGALKTVREIISGFVKLARAIWDRFGDYFVSQLRVIFKTIIGVVRGALQIVRGILKTATALLRGDWRGAWDGIKDILKGAWKIITSILKGAFGVARNIAKAGLNQIVDVVKSIPGKIRALGGLFADAGRAIIGRFVDGLKNAGGVISGIAGNVWNAVKSLLNGAISRINSALEFTVRLPGPDIHINPPDIPPLADAGGVFRGPGLVRVGPITEAMVPLTGPHARRLGGPSVIVQVNGALDPVAVGRQLEQVLRRYVRDTGRPLQVQTL